MSGRVQRIELPGGAVVLARLSTPEGGYGEDDEDVGFVENATAKVHQLERLISEVGASVLSAAAAAGPDEASVSFGVELTAKSGAALAVLAAGEAKASVQVTLTWQLKEQPRGEEGTAVRVRQDARVPATPAADGGPGHTGDPAAQASGPASARVPSAPGAVSPPEAQTTRTTQTTQTAQAGPAARTRQGPLSGPGVPPVQSAPEPEAAPAASRVPSGRHARATPGPGPQTPGAAQPWAAPIPAQGTDGPQDPQPPQDPQFSEALRSRHARLAEALRHRHGRSHPEDRQLQPPPRPPEHPPADPAPPRNPPTPAAQTPGSPQTTEAAQTPRPTPEPPPRPPHPPVPPQPPASTPVAP
ncbi:CU044_2847 family protein [Streptomyces sp. NPDC004838]